MKNRLEVLLKRQASMKAARKPAKRRGRPQRWKAEEEAAEKNQVMLRRARTVAELLLRRGFDTERIAQALRDCFSPLGYINTEKVELWIARGKPL